MVLFTIVIATTMDTVITFMAITVTHIIAATTVTTLLFITITFTVTVTTLITTITTTTNATTAIVVARRVGGTVSGCGFTNRLANTHVLSPIRDIDCHRHAR